MSRPVIFLALPHYGSFGPGIIRAVTQPGQGFRLIVRDASSSKLPVCFNELWCMARNMREERGLTKWVMLHSDIGPEAGWLEMLVAIQEQHGLDVLSVVSPLKDPTGSTSTAAYCPKTGKTARLTMREVAALPETFTSADLQAKWPGRQLLINTGCWICDFTKEWVRKIAFRFQDAIEDLPDGTCRPVGLSEDWIFSLDCHRLGLKVGATRAVRLNHRGIADYPNQGVWGQWETDQEAD